jgi:hypothetical protein
MLDNLTAPRIAVVGQREMDSFETDIAMGGIEEHASNAWVQPSFGSCDIP